MIFDVLADLSTHRALGQILRVAGPGPAWIPDGRSGVPPQTRDIEFPPFDRHHLNNSLKNLAGLAEHRIVS